MESLYLSAVNVYAAGLSDLKDTIIGDWLGPAFIIGVAVFALVFIKDRAWMKLLGFVGIAAVVGLLLFSGGTLFGDGTQNGTVTGIAVDAADQVTGGGGGGLGNSATRP